MTYKEWLSPRRLQEYFVESAVPNYQDATQQLYLAVTSGEVRARWQGTILDPRWFAQRSASDTEPFALPPDVELSVEDAKRKWGGLFR
jgi:hypothetical protein